MERRAANGTYSYSKDDDWTIHDAAEDGSSVEGALRMLVASGELKREGSGKSTCYYKIK